MSSTYVKPRPITQLVCDAFNVFWFFGDWVFFFDPLYSQIFPVIILELLLDELVNGQVFPLMFYHPSVDIIGATNVKDLGIIEGVCNSYYVDTLYVGYFIHLIRPPNFIQKPGAYITGHYLSL